MSLEENEGKLAVFAGIEKVRFRRPVLPGDTLDLITTLTRRRGPIGFGDGEARVGDEVACTASVSFAIIDPNRVSR